MAIIETTDQFRVLGAVPDGSKDASLAVPSFGPEKTPEVVRAVLELAATASAIIDGTRPPIDPARFNIAIRAYRDAKPHGRPGYSWSNQKVSLLDHKLYACRVAEKLLRQLGENVPRAAETNTNAEVDERVRALQVRARTAARRRDVALGDAGSVSSDPPVVSLERPATSPYPRNLDPTFSGEPFPAAPNDPALWQQYERRIRRGQPQFREALLAAYAGRCCISGCGPENVLQAAHIVEHAATGDNSLANGLLLRADLHELFDDGLLRIDPESRRVVLSDNLRDTIYWELNGRELRKPCSGDGPGDATLRQRWVRQVSHSERAR